MSPQNFHSVVSLPTVLPHLVQDQFLPQEPVDVPLNASALSKRLQEPALDRWFFVLAGGDHDSSIKSAVVWKKFVLAHWIVLMIG